MDYFTTEEKNLKQNTAQSEVKAVTDQESGFTTRNRQGGQPQQPEQHQGPTGRRGPKPNRKMDKGHKQETQLVSDKW